MLYIGTLLGSLDKDRNSAVLAVPVNYSKAFNRMLHSDILCNLIALNVPNCAVKLVKSYLTKRTMCVRYRGARSSFQNCPGGGPQGGLLTGALFCLQVNKAGRPCIARPHPSLGQQEAALNQNRTPQAPSMRNSEDPQHQPMDHATEPHHPSLGQPEEYGPALIQELHQAPPCHDREKLHKKSFIDDLTLLERISLSNLVRKETIVGPLNWHDRFQLTLPPDKSILQHQLVDLQIFTEQHHMKLNKSKTKCLPFNNSNTKDFVPQLTLEEGSYLEVIYELKLVGLVLTSDNTWTAHVDYTVARVNRILWQLTRFRQLGATQDKLITFYILKIRSILMFGAVCYHSALTKELSQKLELQQKRSLAVILTSQYRNYKHALSLTLLPRLDTLREETCLKWATKSQANPLHADLFPLNTSEAETRWRPKFREYKCRTDKFYRSAVPSMVRALNHQARNIEK